MKKNIAIIDDDSTLLAMLKSIFEAEGFNVKTYHHTMFTDVLRTEHFDLFLLDVWFDETRAGMEMAQALLRNNNAPEDIIMMSSDQNIEEYATRAGIKNFIRKPLDIELLLEIIDSLNGSSQNQSFSQETVTYTQNLAPILTVLVE